MCKAGDSVVAYASNGLIYEDGIPREFPPQRTPFNNPARIHHHADQPARVGVGADVKRGVIFFTLDGKLKYVYDKMKLATDEWYPYFYAWTNATVEAEVMESTMFDMGRYFHLRDSGGLDFEQHVSINHQIPAYCVHLDTRHGELGRGQGQGEILMMLSHVNVVQFFGMVVPTGSSDNGFYDSGLLLEVADMSLHD
ncbi:hypothetical protein AAVH_23664, partial [Aphelenchoides avenae]